MNVNELVIYRLNDLNSMAKVDGRKTKQFSKIRSVIMKRLWRDPNYRQHMSFVHLGHKHTEETKKKIGRRRGWHHTDEARKRIAITRKLKGYPNPSFLGRTHIEESRKKMALASTGRKQSFETIQKRIAYVIGRKHSKEARRKISERRLQQILPVRNTSIEITLFEILDKLAINYAKHKQIDNICQADAVIYEVKIAIFADGCYWHGCPIHFPQGFEKRRKDENLTRLIQNNGWLVLRFWEHDIRSNILAVENIIRKKYEQLSREVIH